MGIPQTEEVGSEAQQPKGNTNTGENRTTKYV